MYRILVIDDEPIIADGLYELFAQDETFALEVHKVYSAPDALKLLDRLRIDIVLSDIKMPGMNGLELLTQIHRRWPFCHVIFLSGYSDFEYVQKAMQLGADSYILKSQGDEVVLETVYKTLALLEQEGRVYLYRAEKHETDSLGFYELTCTQRLGELLEQSGKLLLLLD